MSKKNTLTLTYVLQSTNFAKSTLGRHLQLKQLSCEQMVRRVLLANIDLGIDILEIFIISGKEKQ